MPKFPYLSDEDLHSIIAFLRSDHPMVQASENNPPACKPSFLAKFLSNVAFKPLPYPSKPIAPPDTTDRVAFGKYIATAKFECYSCHSKSFKTVNLLEPEKSEGFFGGGNPMLNREGEKVVSTNLTMNKENGIGKWTEAQFIKAVKFGIKPDNSAIRYPMVPFPLMTDSEAAAVWAYLQTVPQIDNPNDR